MFAKKTDLFNWFVLSCGYLNHLHCLQQTGIFAECVQRVLVLLWRSGGGDVFDRRGFCERNIAQPFAIVGNRSQPSVTIGERLR